LVEEVAPTAALGNSTLLDVAGKPRFRVALRPLSAVEGGVVAFELMLVRHAEDQDNLLGERSGFDEACRCYPEKPSVIDIAYVSEGVGGSRFGAVRRFAIPGTHEPLVFEVVDIGVGHGVGNCAPCPRIDWLHARVSIAPK
jgi:hypothetical protein